MSAALPLAVTMGEPAGIGGEIALKAWLGRRENGVPPFLMLDDPARLAALAQHLGWAVAIRPIASADQALAVFADALPVLTVPLNGVVAPGEPDPANGGAVVASIDRAVDLVQRGEAGALVTNPIQKSALYAAGFRHPGHTEYLAELAGVTDEPVMMLATTGLRVVPVTIHLSLARAVATLSSQAIVHCGRITARALVQDFAVAKPRIAVAALNPHAGENGAFGDEEATVIAPAIRQLRAEGIAADGPHPADTLFHDEARRGYDAVLCMYHDQALIPLKTIDFAGGVNVTLGLPFVRTSPDHGTALDISGSGAASATSLLAALRLAARMSEWRRLGGARPA